MVGRTTENWMRGREVLDAGVTQWHFLTSTSAAEAVEPSAQGETSLFTFETSDLKTVISASSVVSIIQRRLLVCV